MIRYNGATSRDRQARTRAIHAIFRLLLLIIAIPAHAGEKPVSKIDYFGDFRLRLEQDWDALQGDGSEIDDRLRLRFRLRGGVGIQFSDNWSALVQARSGPDLSQQSPHITIHDFDGGPDGPYDFNLEKWYIGYTSGGLTTWAGRNILSSWHQDDMFIFDNITYAGAGGSYTQGLDSGSLVWHLNYVALPVGMRDFSGTGLFAQLVYDQDFGGSGVTLTAGFTGTRANPDDPDGAILLTGNNTRDYSIFNTQFQYRSSLFDKPLKTGFDYMHNLENYDNETPGSFSEFHKDDIDGYVFELLWGDTRTAGDWQLGYFYANIDALAINSSYTQDDWVRWGNANQVRASNMTGSEFRMRYTIRPDMNIIVRLFFVDAVDFLEPGDTTKETGNRLRIDWNTSF